MAERHAPSPIVTEGAAVSVQASQGGLYLTSSTTAAEFDLRKWAGRYVKIVAEDADTYFLFAEDAGATIDATATASAAVIPPSATMATIPDLLLAGTSVPQVVHPKYGYLRFKTKAGAGGVRVFLS